MSKEVMSFSSRSKDLEQKNRKDLTDIIFNSRSNHINLNPLEDSKANREALRMYFAQIDADNLLNNEPVFESIQLRTQAKRFLIALQAYKDSKDSVIPISYLLENAVEKGFPKLLKLIKFKSFIKSFNLQMFEESEDFKKAPYYEIHDLGQIFKFDYLPHFEEHVEDYEDHFIPLTGKNNLEESLEDVIFNLLPDEIDEIDPSVYLNQMSSSSTYIPETGKSQKLWKRKVQGQVKLTHKALEGRRSVIQVGPANTRDSVILSAEHLATTQAINKQIQEILNKMSESGMKDGLDLEAKIKSIRKKYSYFVCRDIQKEGITKPRRLIIILKRALERKYPNIKIFSYMDIYENFELLIDGKRLETLRGHGLGMANAITTLLQISLFYLTLKEMAREKEFIFEECTCLAYNDDFLTAFKTESDYQTFMQYERDVYEDFSLLIKPEKSFSGMEFNFCEIYSIDSMNKKESYFRTEILMSLLCVNTTHAKFYVNALSNNPYLGEYLDLILDKFGYEFFKDEHKIPFILGGWFSKSYNGVSLDLKDLKEIPGKILASYSASKIKKININKNDNKEYIVREFVDISIPEIMCNIFKKKYKLSELADKYSRLREKGNLWTKYYERLRDRRRKEFLSIRSGIPLDEFYQMVRKDYPLRDFIPPEDLWNIKVKFRTKRMGKSDFVSEITQYKKFLLYYEKNSNRKNQIFEPISFIRDISKKSLNQSDIDFIKEQMFFRLDIYLLDKESNTYFDFSESQREVLNNEYINIQSVADAMFSVYNQTFIPINHIENKEWKEYLEKENFIWDIRIESMLYLEGFRHSVLIDLSSKIKEFDEDSYETILDFREIYNSRIEKEDIENDIIIETIPEEKDKVPENSDPESLFWLFYHDLSSRSNDLYNLYEDLISHHVRMIKISDVIKNYVFKDLDFKKLTYIERRILNKSNLGNLVLQGSEAKLKFGENLNLDSAAFYFSPDMSGNPDTEEDNFIGFNEDEFF